MIKFIASLSQDQLDERRDLLMRVIDLLLHQPSILIPFRQLDIEMAKHFAQHQIRLRPRESGQNGELSGRCPSGCLGFEKVMTHSLLEYL